MTTLRKFTSTALVLAATTAGFVLPDGSASAESSDCPSGYMCLWSGASYTGSIVKISTTGSYRPIGLSSVESYYNHRTKRTWLHEKADGSGSYTCLDPGEKKASGLSGWMDNPKAVWLATITNC